MDAWKRFYSNNDEADSLREWWAQFITDEVKENYTMWYCDYKYADELQVAFMASNLVGGMFQRIEKLRKHVRKLFTQIFLIIVVRSVSFRYRLKLFLVSS